ncbi:polysaccharide deacetylase [Actinophytocola xinjiangensis]|uniref:Polysaccharide deacetylase n=1 Tax=Actinophytocola xinjiangensis TaxID=485602 RepID=A0A7Z0WR46_9PSEU|nr:polysaccharide deacetylase [Actinophytocola xinjiangensis]OLF11043.1 polysaccharide deacetylase [Actinophytocola xinjiangensis]
MSTATERDWDPRPRRRWESITLGVALLVTFLILVSLGTVDPAGEPDDRPDARGTVSKPSWMRPLAEGEKPPQFVLFSFDGAGSHAHWERILPLAEKSGAKVTGFLSGIYLLPDTRRGEYTGPGRAPGRAAISFGGSDDQVSVRIEDLNAATAAGHELGTHYNGHFCAGNEPSAGTWTAEQWRSELDQFFGFVRDAAGRGLRIAENEIRGGRAPCLEGSFPALAPAMAAHGLTYDSSRTSEGIVWPSLEKGIWIFPVPEVRVPGLDGQSVVMQDYNLWYAMNGAREEPSRDAEFTEITLDTYRAAYQAARNTNRAPLTVGTHFNDWSGGAFSMATERFMGEVCGRDETVCATYSQVVEWMSLQDPAVLSRFQSMPAAQVS